MNDPRGIKDEGIIKKRWIKPRQGIKRRREPSGD